MLVKAVEVETVLLASTDLGADLFYVDTNGTWTPNMSAVSLAQSKAVVCEWDHDSRHTSSFQHSSSVKCSSQQLVWVQSGREGAATEVHFTNSDIFAHKMRHSLETGRCTRHRTSRDRSIIHLCWRPLGGHLTEVWTNTCHSVSGANEICTGWRLRWYSSNYVWPRSAFVMRIRLQGRQHCVWRVFMNRFVLSVVYTTAWVHMYTNAALSSCYSVRHFISVPFHWSSFCSKLVSHRAGAWDDLSEPLQDGKDEMSTEYSMLWRAIIAASRSLGSRQWRFQWSYQQFETRLSGPRCQAAHTLIERCCKHTLVPFPQVSILIQCPLRVLLVAKWFGNNVIDELLSIDFSQTKTSVLSIYSKTATKQN